MDDIGRQQMVNIQSQDRFIGATCTNNYLYLVSYALSLHDIFNQSKQLIQKWKLTQSRKQCCTFYLHCYLSHSSQNL